MAVKYDLYCELGHEFEGWFRTDDEFVRQQDYGLVTCPVCECSGVNRISTWIVQTESEIDEAGYSDEYQRTKTLLQQINEFVDQNVENTRELECAAPRRELGKAKQAHSEGVAAVPVPYYSGIDKDKLN
jgi:hypothetical protein